MHFFESKSVEHGVFENWKTTFSNSSHLDVSVVGDVVVPKPRPKGVTKLGNLSIDPDHFDLLSELSIE